MLTRYYNLHRHNFPVYFDTGLSIIHHAVFAFSPWLNKLLTGCKFTDWSEYRQHNDVATTGISSRWCRLVWFLGHEFGTHIATSPQTSLAESTEADTISSVRAGPPLPSWQCTSVPCQDTPSHIWCQLTMRFSFQLHIHISRSANASNHTGRQSICSGCCITGDRQRSDQNLCI